jgi:hypothetical protein
MKLLLFAFAILFLNETAAAQSKWKAELKPGIKLSAPECRGFGRTTSPNYKLCLPSSIVKNLKVSIAGNSVILRGPGAIQGPVLVETKPPVILIGSMIVEKGGMALSFPKAGGFQMKGIEGTFEVQGLILPLSATNPLEVDKIELEFTSPEDALLELYASGQRVGVVLRATKNDGSSYSFVPSPPSNSIFPDNFFFSPFEGRIFKNLLTLLLKNGREIKLEKTGD